MMEVALVFDKEGKTICFHEPAGRTGGAIPDSRNLWDILWENRHNLGGVAHTHPWYGEPWASETDVTTFRAIELGLGKNLLWPIVTFTEVGYFVWNPIAEAYTGIDPGYITFRENLDVAELRAKSR